MGHYRYAIIGNSAAAIHACEAIREVDPNGSVAVFSEERYRCYSRPLISYLLAGKIGAAGMYLRRPDFYRFLEIDFFPGGKVISVDPAKKALKLSSGRIVYWDRLLLSTGFEPFIPSVEGLSSTKYFTFTNWDDAKKLMRVARGPFRALVMGAGLIGMKAAEALHARGGRVVVVEKAERILPAALDPVASSMVAERCRAEGLDLITGCTVVQVRQDSGTGGVAVLEDGSEVEFDLLVVAAGVKPRSELAVEAGIPCLGGAVRVDLHQRTAVPDVFAAGDVSAALDKVIGGPQVNALWPIAALQGRFAGLNMAGRVCSYPGGIPMNSVEFFGLPVLSAGLVNPPDGRYRVLSRHYEDGSYRRLVLDGDRLVGMMVVGAVEGAGIFTSLIREGVSVRGFARSLTEADFGYAHMSRSLRKRRFEAELLRGKQVLGFRKERI